MVEAKRAVAGAGVKACGDMGGDGAAAPLGQVARLEAEVGRVFFG